MGTWQVATLPRGRTAIPAKWVFKRKLTATGQIEPYRARLVLKGFKQIFGVDYDAVFAPVVRASTVRLLFTIVASHDLDCHSVDIKNEFVQSELPEEIYMLQPPGYEDGTRSVLHLKKGLYGLKQASRLWNQTLTTYLISLGFIQCLSDGALMILRSLTYGLVLLMLYVDDIQIAAKSTAGDEYVKKCLLTHYPSRDLGETKFFLQMSIERNRSNRSIIFRQQRHIDQLIEDVGFDSMQPKAIPMITGIYRDDSGRDITDPEAITQYKSILGVLMHIMNYTRPDIAFSVNYLARFVSEPKTSHFARVRPFSTETEKAEIG
jgi:hypothetical protein